MYKMVFRKFLFKGTKKSFSKNVDPVLSEYNSSRKNPSGEISKIQVTKNSSNSGDVNFKGCETTKQQIGKEVHSPKNGTQSVRNDSAKKPSALIAAKMQCSEWYNPSALNGGLNSPRIRQKASTPNHSKANASQRIHPSQKVTMNPPTAKSNNLISDHPAFRSSLYYAPQILNLNKFGKPKRYGPPNGRNLRVVGRILYKIQETEDENLA